MATKDQFLTYYIVLTDADAVAAYQAQYPTGVNRAPYNAGPPAGGAAVEFAAPFKGYIELSQDQAPYIWTPWYSGQGGVFPLDVATFTRKTGGFLGIGGTTTHYYWIGKFIYAQPKAEIAVDPAAPVPTDPGAADIPAFQAAPFAKRRFVEGFEVYDSGPAGISDATSVNCSKDAARLVGGQGLALRSCTLQFSISNSKYRTGNTDNTTWLRLYLRLRKLPTTLGQFYDSQGSPTATNGVRFGITSNGQIYVANRDTDSRDVLGTLPVTLPVWTGLPSHDAWRRFDAIIGYNNKNSAGTAKGIIRCYIDGIHQGTFEVAQADGGLGAASSRWSASRIGSLASGSAGHGGLEIDIDPWIECDAPPGRVWDGTKWLNQYDANTATYNIGDIVYQPAEDRVYICIQGHTSANPKTPSMRANGAYWHRYEGLDWLSGSKVTLARPTVFSANHDASWGTGNAFRILLQNPMAVGLITADTDKLASTTSGAICAVTTDADIVAEQDKQAIGAVAGMVLTQSLRTAGLVGSLGYGLNGTVTTHVLDGAGTTAAEIGTLAGNAFLWTPDGVITDYQDITPLEIRYVKGADANSSNIRQLLMSLELNGQFDAHDWRPDREARPWDSSAVPADDVVIYPWPTAANGVGVPATQAKYYRALVAVVAGLAPDADPTKWEALTPPDFPKNMGVHNFPYPQSPWAQDALAAPSAGVAIVASTYVGNGTGQDLSFRIPPHLLFVRPVTGTGDVGTVWFTSMRGSHQGFKRGISSNISDAREDRTFVPVVGEDTQQQRYIVRIGGSSPQSNQNGVTYQYLAFCDPGQRFALAGQYNHVSADTADRDNILVDPTFTPEFLLLHIEDNSTTTAVSIYGKSTNTAAATLANFNGTAIASAITFGTGKLTSKSALHAVSSDANSFIVFRRADGNNDPGQPGVLAIVNWVGDGNASRTVAIAPASGKRPVWALIFGESGSGYYRDPSHTGTNSTPGSTGTQGATGITAGGIDSISVGLALNANTVNYLGLVFFASSTAGNNGWGTNGEYLPVEASGVNGGAWPSDPDPSDFDEVEPEPESPPDDEPDLATACVTATTRLINIALSRIGVSKVITDLVAENTMEAAIARLHLKTDVDAVLADFPWPFATRYAELVLVGGTEDAPVNVDWQYSYRAPADLVAARRIGGQLYQRRGYDPDPITFRIGSDATGALIYNNAAIEDDTPLVVEYTARVTCPASSGSPLFKDALAWRFAASLAMPLARDSQKQAQCLAMYERVLRQAEAVAANESQLDKGGDAEWITGRN